MARFAPVFFAAACAALAQNAIDITRPGAVTAAGAQPETVEYRGKKALKLSQAQGPAGLGIVKGIDFSDGTIELDVAGAPSAGSAEAARGFVGIAFRVQDDKVRYEHIYIRPTNGRADDQVRRNHSVQYASEPDFPWQRLRKEFPEKYEAYVDLEPGVWTHIRITVSGRSARLYVHGASQPALVVNDLKLPAGRGALALWAGPMADCYYTGLTITPAAR